MLTKPGIIMGNLLTTFAGFALGSQGQFHGGLFFGTLTGLGLIIASACVFNNYLDRHADAKMARTQNRALVRGTISLPSALLFAILLGIAGSFILFFTSVLALFLALFGFFFYVVFYSIWKYRSSSGTLIGTVAGAMPPVVGYCAASNSCDGVALSFFLMMVLWQLPHFFAIALYRLNEYSAASIPILPLTKGLFFTKIHMLFSIVCFIPAALFLIALTQFGIASVLAVSLSSLAWLILCMNGFTAKNERLWARKMFQISLAVLVLLSVIISIDAF